MSEIAAEPAAPYQIGTRTLPLVEDFIRRHPRIQPRPYQTRIISRLIDAWTNPNDKYKHKNVNIESPVGSGKTVVSLAAHALLQEINPYAVTTWSAMRKNLLEQCVREKQEFGLNMRLIPISMFDNDPPRITDAPVAHCEDESHHQAASSAISLREHLNPTWGNGLSGTPYRADGLKLAYSYIIRDATARVLIQDGYLSQFHYYHIRRWNPQSATRVYLSDPERWGRSIMFFHRISECQETTRLLNNAGIPTQIVDDDPSTRIDQLVSFRNENFKVLVGCLTLTEGYNDPDLKTVFMRSSCKGITIQMGGRALRISSKHPYKQIVQAERGWCFMKYATPARQYEYADDQWRGIEPNENADKTAANVLRFIANKAAFGAANLDFVTMANRTSKRRVF